LESRGLEDYSLNAELLASIRYRGGGEVKGDVLKLVKAMAYDERYSFEVPLVKVLE
jgi:hypothetical protein